MMKTRGHRRRQAKQMLRELDLQYPFDINKVCDTVGDRVHKTIRLWPWAMEGKPSGQWVSGETQHVIYYDEMASYWQGIHIVAHELAHILFGDEPIGVSKDSKLPREARYQARGLSRDAYSDPEEDRAETFATLFVLQAQQLAPGEKQSYPGPSSDPKTDAFLQGFEEYYG